MGRIRGKLVSTALALTLSALCLQSIHALNSNAQVLTESGQIARNRSASALYAKLATLPQPAVQSEITRAVYDFLSNDTHADGATVFDSQGRLIAQLGQGNDQLLANPVGHSSAHIPIRSGDLRMGHILLSFQPVRSNAESVFFHAAMAIALVVLSMIIIGSLSNGARTVFLLLRTPVNPG